jgi:hypothetical protein
VSKIRDQIKQAADFERNRHIRDERAARVVLPMALSEVSQYAIDCIKLLLPFAPITGEGPQIEGGMTAPRIPDGILEPIQASARFADTNIAEEIGELVAWLQVQHSRLERLSQLVAGRPGKKMWNAEAIGAIMDAAELHARCGKLFPYSRRSSPDTNLTFQGQLQTALFIAGIVAVDHPGFADAVKARPTPDIWPAPLRGAQDGP